MASQLTTANAGLGKRGSRGQTQVKRFSAFHAQLLAAPIAPYNHQQDLSALECSVVVERLQNGAREQTHSMRQRRVTINCRPRVAMA